MFALTAAVDPLQYPPWAIRAPESVSISKEFDVNTNYHETWPNTGVTREYWFDIVNTAAMAPDGFERVVLTVNGTLPGLTIHADCSWGRGW